jgi:putative colanic acid biosynthesis acetyltransferase WcaF
MMQKLNEFNNNWYKPGNILIRIYWYIISLIFFENKFPFPNFFKIFLLKLLGSEIGRNVLIKPNVIIKYPWNLKIGSNVWIGEKVWLDNLAMINIGDNVCISQGAMLLTGNHNWNSESFDLIVEPIVIMNEVWIGAKSIVLPKTILAQGSILCAGSVLSKETSKNSIYSGNPAIKIKERK